MTPTKLGRYNLLERIGVSDIAEIYKARSSGAAGFEKTVAIKVLAPDVEGNEAFVAMLTEEARVSASLAHAHIAQVYEFGRIDGRYFLAMEYLHGTDLGNILGRFAQSERPMPLPLAMHIAHAASCALAYAHSRTDASGRPLNIVHLGVSPRNIMVSFEGAVKLTDFGVARAGANMPRRDSRAHPAAGYMSPEQLTGGEVDRRSDVFSAGCVFYECAVGRPAFRVATEAETIERVKQGDFARPREVNPDLPEEIENILLRAMSYDPDARYQMARELEQDIEAVAHRSRLTFNAKQLARWMKTTFAEPKRYDSEWLANAPTGVDGGGQVDEADTRRPTILGLGDFDTFRMTPEALQQASTQLADSGRADSGPQRKMAPERLDTAPGDVSDGSAQGRGPDMAPEVLREVEATSDEAISALGTQDIERSASSENDFAQTLPLETRPTNDERAPRGAFAQDGAIDQRGRLPVEIPTGTAALCPEELEAMAAEEDDADADAAAWDDGPTVLDTGEPPYEHDGEGAADVEEIPEVLVTDGLITGHENTMLVSDTGTPVSRDTATDENVDAVATAEHEGQADTGEISAEDDIAEDDVVEDEGEATQISTSPLLAEDLEQEQIDEIDEAEIDEAEIDQTKTEAKPKKPPKGKPKGKAKKTAKRKDTAKGKAAKRKGKKGEGGKQRVGWLFTVGLVGAIALVVTGAVLMTFVFLRKGNDSGGDSMKAAVISNDQAAELVDNREQVNKQKPDSNAAGHPARSATNTADAKAADAGVASEADGRIESAADATIADASGGATIDARPVVDAQPVVDVRSVIDGQLGVDAQPARVMPDAVTKRDTKPVTPKRDTKPVTPKRDTKPVTPKRDTKPTRPKKPVVRATPIKKPIKPKPQRRPDRTKPKEPRKPVVAGPSGYLIVASRPQAAVYVDGRKTGRNTPIRPSSPLTLSPGQHKIKLVANGRSFKYTVTIKPNGTTKLVKVLPLP